MAPPPPPLSALASSRRRRRGRKRKPVAHYTDDNPSTFTTKQKRQEQPTELTDKDDSTTNDKTTRTSGSGMAATAGTRGTRRTTGSSGSAHPTTRGNRRKRPLTARQTTPASSSSSSATSSTKQQHDDDGKPTKTEIDIDDNEMIVHTHDMRLHSFLPNMIPNQAQQRARDSFLTPPRRPLPKPEWQLVSTPHMSESSTSSVGSGSTSGNNNNNNATTTTTAAASSSEAQAAQSVQQQAAASVNATLVNRKHQQQQPPPRITCMDIVTLQQTTTTTAAAATAAAHSETSGNHGYMALGNALGQVFLYSLEPLVLHVATIETTASARHVAQEQVAAAANANATAVNATNTAGTAGTAGCTDSSTGGAARNTNATTTSSGGRGRGRGRPRGVRIADRASGGYGRKRFQEEHAITCIAISSSSSSSSTTSSNRAMVVVVVVATHLEIECYHIHVDQHNTIGGGGIAAGTAAHGSHWQNENDENVATLMWTFPLVHPGEGAAATGVTAAAAVNPLAGRSPLIHSKVQKLSIHPEHPNHVLVSVVNAAANASTAAASARGANNNGNRLQQQGDTTKKETEVVSSLSSSLPTRSCLWLLSSPPPPTNGICDDEKLWTSPSTAYASTITAARRPVQQVQHKNVLPSTVFRCAALWDCSPPTPAAASAAAGVSSTTTTAATTTCSTNKRHEGKEDAMSTLSSHRIVAVTTMRNEQKPQQLVLIKMKTDTDAETTSDDESPDAKFSDDEDCDNEDTAAVSTTRVLQRANIVGTSSKATRCVESLSQVGKYTLVASGKGVRVYETDTLALVHTHGEGLTLHGHGVVYQQATVFGQVSTTPTGDATSSTSMTSAGGALVVGVPHYKWEPREWQNDLHFWQWQWDSVHPFFSIKGPPRSLGLAHVWCHASSDKSMLLALTHAGDVWMLSPTATTDWPGVMYPPGYTVIDDNLAYIEDEDELDSVVVCLEYSGPTGEYDDDGILQDELAEALRISMLEQAAVQPEPDVDIVNHVDCSGVVHEQAMDNMCFIPCHPDPCLKDMISQADESDAGAVSSPGRKSPSCFLRQVLREMPHRKGASVALLNAREQPRVRALEAMPASSGTAGCGPRGGGRTKRSRAGNLESMIRASIDAKLQKLMISKEQWVDGAGSTLQDRDKVQPTIKMAPEEAVAEGKAAATGKEETPWEVSKLRTNMFQKEEFLSANGETRKAAADTTSTAAHGFGQDATVRHTTLSEVIALRPIDDAATSALEGMLALQRSFSEDASPKKSNATTPLSTVPPVPHFDNTAVTDTVGATYAAAASDPANSSTSAVKKSVEVDAQHVSAVERDVRTDLPQANATTAQANGDPSIVASATGRPAPTEKHIVSQSEGSSPRPTNVSLFSAENEMNGKAVGQEPQTNVSKVPFCSACRGRLVIHTCGKREVPLDLESIERAEKEKLEKEQEEKKRQRAEKRRQADARRREARKLKKQEEERQKRIEEERRRREEEHERSQKEAEERFTGDHYERDRRRAEMLQRLMAANGGSLQDESYDTQEDQEVQVTEGTAQPAFSPLAVGQRSSLDEASVRSPYGQLQSAQLNNESYYQDQRPYEQPRNHSSAVQEQMVVQSPHFSSLQGEGRPTRESASSPLQSVGIQGQREAVLGATPGLEQQYMVASLQQSTPTSRTPATFQSPSSAPNNSDIQQTYESPFGQAPTQLDGSSVVDEQPPPGSATLERRTSLQLGTAEALASLASMCVQMPRAPTPKASPNESNDTESASTAMNVESSSLNVNHHSISGGGATPCSQYHDNASLQTLASVNGGNLSGEETTHLASRSIAGAGRHAQQEECAGPSPSLPNGSAPHHSIADSQQSASAALNSAAIQQSLNALIDTNASEQSQDAPTEVTPFGNVLDSINNTESNDESPARTHEQSVQYVVQVASATTSETTQAVSVSDQTESATKQAS